MYRSETWAMTVMDFKRMITWGGILCTSERAKNMENKNKSGI
jgi:hypothetical protein